jgi:hypothetical protein
VLLAISVPLAEVALSERFVHGLDWAGRIAVSGAIMGFALGFELRRRGYRRIRRVGNLSEMLPPSPLDFSGYWGLTGIVVGFIVGLIHG